MCCNVKLSIKCGKIFDLFLQVLMLKKAVNKFKGQISDGMSSANSETPTNPFGNSGVGNAAVNFSGGGSNINNNNHSNTSSPSPRVLRERIVNRLHSARSISHVSQIT